MADCSQNAKKEKNRGSECIIEVSVLNSNTYDYWLLYRDKAVTCQ